MKKCRECAFHRKTLASQTGPLYNKYYDDGCIKLKGKSHPVTAGEIDHIKCDVMRTSESLCGWEGKFWESKG